MTKQFVYLLIASILLLHPANAATGVDVSN